MQFIAQNTDKIAWNLYWKTRSITSLRQRISGRSRASRTRYYEEIKTIKNL